MPLTLANVMRCAMVEIARRADEIGGMKLFAIKTAAAVLGVIMTLPMAQAAPAAPIQAGPPSPGIIEMAQSSTGATTTRRGDRQRLEERRGDRGHRDVRRGNVQRDCHRDVRTHRIGGRMVAHRHVGPDCRMREVYQSTVPIDR